MLSKITLRRYLPLDKHVELINKEAAARVPVARRNNGRQLRVIDTLHAAAYAIDRWFSANGVNFPAEAVTARRHMLTLIMGRSNVDAVVSDQNNGEDYAIRNIRSWTDLTKTFCICLRESRLLRPQGVTISDPDFMVYPPRILLRLLQT
jgi:hypothetical protein